MTLLLLGLGVSHASDARRALVETRRPDPYANVPHFPIDASALTTRVLLAGDSWAQYMWDDGSHNLLFDRFGHGDARALGASLAEDPGPGYGGPEYTVSGSQAAHWVDAANYPWLANALAALAAQPQIDVVVLSIGGNDLLAGKSDGGWYKDMDLDVPGSEAALLDRVIADTATIIDAMLAVRPELRVMLSSYDYPNFNVGFWCFLSACPMRRNLSRDPANDMVTDAELNAMLVQVEQRRIDLANTNPRILYDNSVGLMHAVYGDGVSGPGVLPRPGHLPPTYAPFPAGNPLRPSLRSCFRRPDGIDADPIHLDLEGYQYKIAEQVRGWFWPHFRDNPTATLFSLGGTADGWTDGVTIGNTDVRAGDNGSARVAGLVTFDTSSLPADAVITRAALYLQRASASGGNPFTSGALGAPRLDVARGSFGAAAVEASDLDAPADASDAGVAYGSVSMNAAVVRFQLNAAGLAAIETGGTTQFRVAFPSIGGGAGSDVVVFHDGDAALPANSGLPTLAEFVGSAAPFLDVEYQVPTDVVSTRLGAAPASTWPNPFTSATTIHFTVRAPGDVDVSVFDVAGRRVVRLLGMSLPRGRHELVWDGRDSRGGRVPAGVYMARLSDRAGQRSVRLVVLEP